LFAVPGRLGLRPAAPNPNHYLFLQNYEGYSQDAVRFAQVSYKVIDTVKITGNVRFSQDNKWGRRRTAMFAFNSSFIDPLQGLFGAFTPSFDENAVRDLSDRDSVRPAAPPVTADPGQGR